MSISVNSTSKTERFRTSIRHARYYEEVLQRCKRLFLRGSAKALRGLSLFDLEWPNISAAQAWSEKHMNVSQEAARLTSAIPLAGIHIVILRLSAIQKVTWFEGGLRAARLLGDTSAEGKHLGNLGGAYINLGRYSEAIRCLEQDLALCRLAGNRKGEGQALGSLGVAYSDSGDHNKAIECHSNALIIDRDLGNQRAIAEDLGNLGVVHKELHEYETARGLQEEALTIARAIGDQLGEACALAELGYIDHCLGRGEDALPRLARALLLSRLVGAEKHEAAALYYEALVLRGKKDSAASSRLAEAVRIARRISHPSLEELEARLREWLGADS